MKRGVLWIVLWVMLAVAAAVMLVYALTAEKNAVPWPAFWHGIGASLITGLVVGLFLWRFERHVDSRVQTAETRADQAEQRAGAAEDSVRSLRDEMESRVAAHTDDVQAYAQAMEERPTVENVAALLKAGYGCGVYKDGDDASVRVEVNGRLLLSLARGAYLDPEVGRPVIAVQIQLLDVLGHTTYEPVNVPLPVDFADAVELLVTQVRQEQTHWSGDFAEEVDAALTNFARFTCGVVTAMRAPSTPLMPGRVDTIIDAEWAVGPGRFVARDGGALLWDMLTDEDRQTPLLQRLFAHPASRIETRRREKLRDRQKRKRQASVVSPRWRP